MIGGAKGIGLGIDLGLVNQYNRTGSQSYIEPEVLDSLVGVWSAYGMTNDSPNRSTIKNKLSNKGGDFVISNAAFKLNSGFGKYEVDFTSWIQTDGVIASSDKVQNSITGRFLYFNTVNKKEDVPSFKVNITLGQQSKLQYNYIKEDGTSTYIVYSESGIYTIPASYFSKYTGGNAWFGFYQIEGTSTIEQIPSFEGAFVTDGIDDLITSTKTVQEMLRGSSEYTVLSMIHHIDVPEGNIHSNTVRIKLGSWGTSNRITSFSNNKTGIYGYTVKNQNITVINNILGDKNDYGIRGGDYTSNLEAKFSVVGWIGEDDILRETASVAWYWTIIANKVLTTDQINQVIAYFNLDRTLNPDILCNTIKQGITNENHAEFGDRLIDFSGNGRDIQMYNLAWNGDSGIGDYEVDFTTWNTYGGLTVSKNSFSIKSELSSNIIIQSKKNYKAPSFKIKIKGLPKGGAIQYRRADKSGSGYYQDFDSDGDYECMAGYDGGYSSFIVSGDKSLYVGVTVEQISSKIGALCLDGVNDFGKVTGMPIYKDFTVIAGREFIGEHTGAVISKSYAGNQGSFYFESGSSVASFGKITSLAVKENIFISYLSKYVYSGDNIESGSSVDSDAMWLGILRDGDSRFSNIAIYSLMSFPYSMSEFLIERQLKKHKLGTLYPNMVEFRPVIKANANYNIFYTALLPLTGIVWEKINIGDYIPVGRRVAIQLSFDNEVSELVSAISSQLGNISITKNSNNKGYTIFGNILKNKSPQKINITIDEYIRYEDIVQPYPVLLRFNDENGNEVSWGGKFRVGSTITRIGSAADSNLLPNIYNIFGLLLNDNQVTSSKVIVEKTMVFKAKSAYIFDNNEPKVILSPSRLRIPNSSYKILGYIPDISGHDNHGVIHNSAYEGVSGANGYLQNFSEWTKASGVSSTDSVISSSNNLVAANAWIAYVTSGTVIPTFKVEISGIPVNGNLRFEGSDQTLVNGVNTIQGITTTKVTGFYISSGYDNDWSNLKIEQIGEYEGAYCLDGVDDFVTIPTTVGGKQVLMKVNSRKSDCYLYDQRNDWAQYLGIVSTKDFIAYNYSNQRGKTYIDGILNENITANDLISITHNITVTNNRDDVEQYFPCIGTSFAKNSFAEMALYDFMLFDNISTDDKIKELNEYIGIEAKVELPPYYWDAYGKTNLDVDRGIVPQLGIAKDYSFASFDNEMAWYLIPNDNYINVVSRNGYEITLKNLSTGVNGWRFQNSTVKGFISHDIPFRIKANKSIRVYWDMHSYKVSTGAEFGEVISITNVSPNKDTYINLRHLTEEELAKLDTNKDRMYYLLWFDLSTIAVNEEVVIEMLPVEGGRNLWLNNYNFAYDKMSGFGGYEFDKFTNTSRWIETKRENGIEVIEKNDYSFTAKRVGTGEYFWDFKNNSIKTLDKELTVKAVSNNNVSIRWEFKYRTAEKPDIDSVIVLVKQAMTPNVPITVTLPYKTTEEQIELGVIEGSTYYLFYFDPTDIPVNREYTVEMLPLYPNGLVYDAVTDYSKNSNIPALDDFTAIMKRKWLKKQGCPLIKGSKVYEGGNGNALLFEWDKAYNFVFYKRTDIIEGELPDNISFITPTNYNGNVITRGSEQDTNGICIAGDGNAGFANIVFYKLVLYPKTIPLLQINFLKNLMERDEIIDLNNKIFIQE